MGCSKCNKTREGNSKIVIKTDPVVRALTPPSTLKSSSTNILVPKGVHKLVLKNHQSPGDIVMMTAAVRDLHRAYPGRFITDVVTTCEEIWENNPYITRFPHSEGTEIRLGYTDLINKSNTTPHHFIHGMVQDLEQRLGIRIPCTELKGDIYISEEEMSWMNQVEEAENGGHSGPFWLVAAGGKYDFTAKWWHPDYYQKVVDHFKGRITFVQIGHREHFHTPLKNVIDMTGKTSLRQLIRLVYHSVGVLCPVTFLMHAAAAIRTGPRGPLNRAGVVIAGGREPAHWESYPFHRHLSLQGSLPCCAHGGCWKSRATLVNDKDLKNSDGICSQPVEIRPKTPYPKDRIEGPLKIGQCMKMITPGHVIDAIESYYKGGVLQYESNERD
jgi:hypothetical protein